MERTTVKEQELIENIGKLHTTEMGSRRIQRNLGLDDGDAVAYCRAKIMEQGAAIERRGKNWYVRVHGCVITVNASSYTIITAHKEKEARIEQGIPGLCSGTAFGTGWQDLPGNDGGIHHP